MRVSFALLAFVVFAPATAGGAATIPDKRAGDLTAQLNRCPPTASSYYARKIGDYRGPRLTPKKLTELPQATSYMAVLREIGGCDAPLTMVEYRNGPVTVEPTGKYRR